MPATGQKVWENRNESKIVGRWINIFFVNLIWTQSRNTWIGKILSSDILKTKIPNVWTLMTGHCSFIFQNQYVLQICYNTNKYELSLRLQNELNVLVYG